MTVLSTQTDPHHDNWIADLLKTGKIVVYEDEFDLSWDEEAEKWRPTTKILFRNDLHREIRYQPANLHPDKDGYPRLRIHVRTNGKDRSVWFRVHRLVWVAFFGPTHHEIDHKDQNRENFNRWNLRPLSRVDQMYNRLGRKRLDYDGGEEEEAKSSSGPESTTSYLDKPPNAPF